MIWAANGALMPTRTLQTWQITLACWLSNLIFCSSQNPISRKRCVTSGEAESCLMRTAVPARTWLSGHMKGWRHSDSEPHGCSLIRPKITPSNPHWQGANHVLAPKPQYLQTLGQFRFDAPQD